MKVKGLVSWLLLCHGDAEQSRSPTLTTRARLPDTTAVPLSSSRATSGPSDPSLPLRGKHDSLAPLATRPRSPSSSRSGSGGSSGTTKWYNGHHDQQVQLSEECENAC
jgi:hypothetical protein